MNKRKIGVLGGSFNPIHNGHLYLAETVLKKLELDEIIFVPSNISPHKSCGEFVSPQHRMNMIELAIEYNEKFSVSNYELLQDRVSYTVLTIRHFREVFSDAQLFLLVGSDMLMSFDRWYCYGEILSNATLAAISRNQGETAALRGKAAELGDVIIIDVPPQTVSSTEIRKKIKENSNFSCYLPENVVQYILENDLYGR